LALLGIAMSHTFAVALFTGVGGISCLAAVALAVHQMRFRRRAVRSVGLVRERQVKSSPDPDGGSMQLVTVTVEYEDETGTRHQASSPIVSGGISWGRPGQPRAGGIGPPDCAVGDRVAILYDPDHPEGIRIDTAINRWFGVVVMAVVGAGLLAVGLMIANGAAG
jgi:Protein of unknown function (DUF3592)